MAASMVCPNDARFGPVSDCRVFDFTLKFEDSVLRIIPVALLCAVTVFIVGAARGRIRCVRPLTGLLRIKIVLNGAFAILSILLTAMSIRDCMHDGGVARAASVMPLLEGLALGMASMAQHFYSPSPSAFLGLYLAITVLTNAVLVRTSAIAGISADRLGVLCATFAIRCLLNLSENWTKRSILLESFLQNSTPETLSSFWSSSCLQLWLLPLFNTGYNRQLELDEVAGYYSSSTAERDAKALLEAFQASKSLSRAISTTFKWQMLASAGPGLIFVGTTLGQPELISSFIAFTESYSTMTPQPAYHGWGLVVACFLLYFTLATAKSTYLLLNLHLTTRFRGAMVSLLYSKSLTISTSENGAHSGNAATYMSVDVQKICEMFRLLHDPWQNLMIVGIALFLLYRQLGYAMFAVLGVTSAIIFMPVILGPAILKANSNWTGETEKRVGLVTSFLQNMKAIKLSAYEKTVVRPRISTLRDTELHLLTKWFQLTVYTILCGDGSDSIATASGFLAYGLIYVRTGKQLDTQVTFTALSLIIVLVQPLGIIMHTLPNIFAAWGSITRLQKFLSANDFERSADTSSTSAETWKDPVVGTAEIHVDEPDFALSPLKSQSRRLKLKDASFRWSSQAEADTLHRLSIDFPAGKLSMVVGEVGSGKTCLLLSLLRETHLSGGTVDRPDLPIAFCSQNAWIRNATLKANITSMYPYDTTWYNRVIFSCALVRDIMLMKDGDQTLIGSKGQNLSGGQKQRIALARALYSRAPIYLLDDVFSAIDKSTEAHIFTSLFGPGGLLRGKTVVLVSHGISRLSSADKIILLREGSVAEQGDWAELSKSNGPVASLLTEARTQQDKHEGDDGENDKPRATDQGKDIGDYQVVDTTQVIQYARGFDVYRWYFTIIGHGQFFIVILSAIIASVASVSLQLWLRHWANQSADEARSTLGYYLGIMWVFVLVYLGFFLVTLNCVAYLWSVRAGSTIHSQLLNSILQTRFSFFNNNPVGFILNRFTQDVFAVDFEIPVNLVNVIIGCTLAMAQFGVVVAAVPFVAVTIPFLLTGLFLLQKYYLRTSRQVKTLALESKTPLYTSFLETLEGLTTIRAARLEEDYLRANSQHIHYSQPTFFLNYATMRGINQVLDLMTTLLVTCLAILAVATRHSASAGLIGLAFIQISQLQSNLTYIIVAFTNLETSMIAVERIRDFIALPREDLLPDVNHGEWLSRGEVEFKEVSAKYVDKEDADLTLRDVSFKVSAGEKIGICGRTGSGKSSLLLTLFRAMDYQTGKIVIDGIETDSLSLEELRSSLTIVPQDPALWRGSIRDNLDPEGLKSDTELWTVIERVGLKDHLQKLEGGLDYFLNSGGDQFSAGQNQLICLARACLKKSKIVVLDEASSNLDILTDQIIQEVIRDVFKDATVFTIAHRIQTILDYDKILILEAGQIAEFDTPAALLANANSRLSDMRVTEQEEQQSRAASLTASEEIQPIPY